MDDACCLLATAMLKDSAIMCDRAAAHLRVLTSVIGAQMGFTQVENGHS